MPKNWTQLEESYCHELWNTNDSWRRFSSLCEHELSRSPTFSIDITNDSLQSNFTLNIESISLVIGIEETWKLTQPKITFNENSEILFQRIDERHHFLLQSNLVHNESTIWKWLRSGKLQRQWLLTEHQRWLWIWMLRCRDLLNKRRLPVDLRSLIVGSTCSCKFLLRSRKFGLFAYLVALSTKFDIFCLLWKTLSLRLLTANSMICVVFLQKVNFAPSRFSLQSISSSFGGIFSAHLESVWLLHS